MDAVKKANPSINEKMRAILVDWLVDVCINFKLNDYSLHLGVTILDRYILAPKKYEITRCTLQAVGITCMVIACKITEVYSPNIADWNYISDNSVKVEDIQKYELDILRAMDYDVMVDTLMFEYEKSAVLDPNVKYFLDMCLMDFALLQNNPLDCIVESCTELHYEKGNFWSTCMERIQNITNAHATSNGSLHAIYQKHKMKQKSENHLKSDIQ